MPRKSNKSLSWENRGSRVSAPIDKRYNKHYFDHDDRDVRFGTGSYLGGTRPRVSFETQRSHKTVKRSNVTLANLDEDITMTSPNNNMRQVMVRGKGRGSGSRGRTRPRVSFKAQRSHKTVKRSNVTLVNLDEDITMTSTNNNMRQVMVRGKGRGSGSRGRNSPLPIRNFHEGQSVGSKVQAKQLSDCEWFKISIPFGHKYEKDFILRSLLNYVAPDTFVPMNYKVMDNSATFYLDNQKVAHALMNANCKITLADGFKMRIKVKPGFPQCEIDDKLKERLKQAMAKRYIADTNALDLSKFHQDPDLVADYFCALVRPAMLTAVLDIVTEHIPTLEALNLEYNKLHLIQGLDVLSEKLPKLKILYIGYNQIREMNQLDVLKDLKLEEMRLEGNPVWKKFMCRSRQADYVSEVRKRIPKLMRLDEKELPRPILFDGVDEAAKVPSSQRIFASNAKTHEIASRFLQQYFMIFDSDNRQPLLNAYDEHACFGLTITYTPSKLNGYLAENRNLFRVHDSSKRMKLLKNGKLSVVSFLSEMPRTTHLLDTFTMDITLPTPTMMFVTLTGYFQEINNKEELIRYFNRTFVIIPEGTGYCICNEQLHISQPTDVQLKRLKSQLSQSGQPTPLLPQGSTQQSASMVPQTSVSQPTPLVPQMPTVVQTAKPMETTELSEEIKQQMMVTLSQQTNMNLEWSLKCLNEVQWNYNNALSAFQNFFWLGQIPPEAFAK